MEEFKKIFCDVAQWIYRRIIELVLKASDLGRAIGMDNLLQPGLVKEMIIVDILNHRLIYSKRDAEACSINDGNESMDTCLAGKDGADNWTGCSRRLPRSDQHPCEESREIQLFTPLFLTPTTRRNARGYKIEPKILLLETERKLNKSESDIFHVGFTETWARRDGMIVYEDTKFNRGNAREPLNRSILRLLDRYSTAVAGAYDQLIGT